MHPRLLGQIGLLICLLMGSSCEPWDPMVEFDPGDEALLPPWGAVSVYELANRLEMRVGSSTAMSAELNGNGANTVSVYSHPSSRIYVNGRLTPNDQPLVAVGETIFVPESLAQRIRSQLRPVRPIEPYRPPAPPARPRRPLPPLAPVVIDAGHGGKDPGAIGVGGVYEKEINLAVALKVAAILRSHKIPVILTRSTDEFIELNERAAIANRARASLFVSIHSDSAPNSSAQGYTLFVRRDPPATCVRLAKSIAYHMGRTGASGRGQQEQDFRVLVRTRCPSALVELGFLSNAYEAAALQRDHYQRLLATAVAQGILEAHAKQASIPRR
jgi:N-acetylmuramoyl-L-alanine amidase